MARLQAFRVQNFRSIVDSGWIDLSPDTITALIGQNESGKTSILEALFWFDDHTFDPDVLRTDGTLPRVSFSYRLEESLSSIFPEEKLPRGMVKRVKELGSRVNLVREMLAAEDGSSEVHVEDPELLALFSSEDPDVMEEEDFAQKFWKATPYVTFFDDWESLLPNGISLEDVEQKNEDAEGYRGALNFLTIAGVDMDILRTGNPRMIENHIQKLNKTVTADFREYWTQKIGVERISLEFSLEHYDETRGNLAGKPYFAFWIRDGLERLYPKQRSKGVRWFLSFFLQLKASDLNKTANGHIYYIDEPGASLHAKAQRDVLHVLESIKSNVQVVYTTHSPYLIDTDKVYRILAVQRTNTEDEGAPTTVLSAHELGAATTDTLSPLYTAMGVDLSHQNVIKSRGNVLLEEVSALYYLNAFWRLLGLKNKPSFIPASGVSNLPLLVNLFLGWGLDFIVVADDDPAGKRVLRELKRDIFGDSEQESTRRLLSVRGAQGIEDVFSRQDFEAFVIDGTGGTVGRKRNSEYLKACQLSKPALALRFGNRVESGEISLSDFTPESSSAMSTLCDAIRERTSQVAAAASTPATP